MEVFTTNKHHPQKQNQKEHDISGSRDFLDSESAALALAPLFDRFISFVEARTGLSRGGAFGVYIALLGITTCTLVFGSIFLACGPGAYARG